MKYLALIAAMALALLAEESRGPAAKPARTSVRVAAAESDPPLDRDAFSAKLDGSPAKVLRAQGPKDDLVLLVVLDLNGDPSLVDSAKESLTNDLEKLAPNHWVGVMRAQDRLQALVDPTADRKRVIDAVKDYAATGKAGLLDTVEPVSALAQRVLLRTGVRVAILYITDSNISNYREDYTNPVINSSDSRDLSRKFPDQLVKEKIQKISDQLARFETPVFVVQISYFGDPINEAYQRGLMQLAQEMGGAGIACRSRGEIAAAVERIVGLASSHWSVAVELKDPKQRAVTVELSNGERGVLSRARFALRK